MHLTEFPPKHSARRLDRAVSAFDSKHSAPDLHIFRGPTGLGPGIAAGDGAALGAISRGVVMSPVVAFAVAVPHETPQPGAPVRQAATTGMTTGSDACSDVILGGTDVTLVHLRLCHGLPTCRPGT